MDFQLSKLLCFPLKLAYDTFQNQSYVSRKSKIRKWKKLKDSVLINHLIINLK